jgi:hypothetical protein
MLEPVTIPTEDQLWRHSSRLKSAREKMNAIIASDDAVKTATPSEEYKRTLTKVWPEDEKQCGYVLYEDEGGATFWVRDKTTQLVEEPDEDGDVLDPEDWREAFPKVGECELPKPEAIVDELLLKGCIHVWAGMFESYKTIAAIELCAAILDGRPAFDHFAVKHQHPIMFLCPDMSPELFQDYARPFGLLSKNCRWQHPKSEVFYSIDSPVLQRAVDGRVLVLDTMLDYAQIQKAFESAEWIQFFKKLRSLINVCGCVAIVMLVHPTKSGARSNSIDPSEYLKDSVTFGGKIDVGLAFSKLENTSQVFVQRIKGRGFKQQQFSFTIAYLDDEGNSNLDRGRFPVYLKPGEAGKKEDHTPNAGRKPNPQKEQQTQLILQLRGERKTFKEIAKQVGIPESTARSYYNQSTSTFDSNIGDNNNANAE